MISLPLLILINLPLTLAVAYTGNVTYNRCIDSNVNEKTCSKVYALTIKVNSAEDFTLHLADLSIRIMDIHPYIYYTLWNGKSCYGGLPVTGGEHTKKNECLRHKYHNNFCSVDCGKDIYGSKSNILETYVVCLECVWLADFYELDFYELKGAQIYYTMTMIINDESYIYDSYFKNFTFHLINSTEVTIQPIIVEAYNRLDLIYDKYFVIKRNEKFEVQKLFTLNAMKYGPHEYCGFNSSKSSPDYRAFYYYRDDYNLKWSKNHWVVKYIGFQNWELFTDFNITHKSLQTTNSLRLVQNSHMLSTSRTVIYLLYGDCQDEYDAGTFWAVSASFCYNDSSVLKRTAHSTWTVGGCTISKVEASASHIVFNSLIKCATLYMDQKGCYYVKVSKSAESLSDPFQSYVLLCYSESVNNNVWVQYDMSAKNLTYSSSLHADSADSINTISYELPAILEYQLITNITNVLEIKEVRCLGQIYSEKLSSNNTYKFCFTGCDGTKIINDNNEFCTLNHSCCYIHTMTDGHVCLLDAYRDNCITVKLDQNTFIIHYNNEPKGVVKLWREHKVLTSLIFWLSLFVLILIICCIIKCCKRKNNELPITSGTNTNKSCNFCCCIKRLICCCSCRREKTHTL